MDQEEFDMMPEAVEDESELDPNDPNNSFAILEKNYIKIVGEMEEAGVNYAKYLEEFTKLFDFLYITHENLLQLDENNKRMETELLANIETLRNNEELIQSGASVINKLKDEIDLVHALIDNAHAREQSSQEIIDNLRIQIANLQAEIELQKKMSESILDISSSSELPKKHDLEREKFKLESEITKLHEKLSNALVYQEELDQRLTHTHVERNQLSIQLEERSDERDDFKRKRNSLQQNLDFKQDELNELQYEITVCQNKLAKSEETIKEVTLTLNQEKKISTKLDKDLEISKKQCYDFRKSYNEALNEIKELNAQKDLIDKKLTQSEETLKRIELKTQSISKEKDMKVNASELLHDELVNKEMENAKQRKMMFKLHRERERQRKDIERSKQEIEYTKRQKELLLKNIEHAQDEIKKYSDKVRLHSIVQMELEETIKIYKAKAQEDEIELEKLKKKQNQKRMELSMKDDEIDLLGKEKTKLKSEIAKFGETIIASTRKMNKAQIELDDEQKAKNEVIKDKRSLEADLNHQLELWKLSQFRNKNLKDEQTAQTRMILKERAKAKKITKEKDLLKIELSNAIAEKNSLKEEKINAKIDRKQLTDLLAKNDKIVREQCETINTMMTERDILSKQITNRDNELFLLYDKAKLLQQALHTGETQYQQRLDDISLLKLEIKRLKQEKQRLSQVISCMPNLKQEVLHLERDLTKTRLKNKCLESEMSNPLNIHRWRSLQGKDPGAYVLIQKISVLQKRYIKQNNKLLERERQLKELQKMHTRLKNMVSKQPEKSGPDTAKSLEVLKKDLTENATITKSLKFEIERLEIEDKKNTILLTKATSELNEAKRQLSVEKKKRTKDMATIRSMVKLSASLTTSNDNVVKYTGGGFRMAVSTTPVNPILRNP